MKKTFKAIICVALCFVMLSSLVGCGPSRGDLVGAWQYGEYALYLKADGTIKYTNSNNVEYGGYWEFDEKEEVILYYYNSSDETPMIYKVECEFKYGYLFVGSSLVSPLISSESAYARFEKVV